MKKLLLLFSLLCASLAFGQGVIVAPQTAFKVVNGLTSPIANATITVCAGNAAGIPCSPALANSIFKDAALTIPLSNPFFSDFVGNYQFAIAPGNYTVTVTNVGFNGQSYQMTVATPISLASGLTDPGANGVVFRNGFGTTRPAVSADVIALFSGSCSVSTFIRGDGSCAAVGGVTSVFGRTGAVVAAANDYTFDQIGAGSNLNALSMGNAGSLKPVNLGQVAGNQAWLQAGISAPSISYVTTGGSINSGHQEVVRYTLVNGAGQTSSSALVNASSLIPLGCTTGTTCTLTVTAPTIPSGYTGYSVYAQDCNSTCTIGSEVLQASCTNISTNCVLTSVSNSGTALPTGDSAILQPTNIQAYTLVPAGALPSFYFPKTDGNYYPLAGMDFSSGSPLPSPDGTFEFWHRFFVTDSGQSIAGATQQGAGLIKNALFSISHLSGQTTSTGSSTDDRVFAYRGVDSTTSSTYEQWLGIYGEHFIYNNNFSCNPVGSLMVQEDCFAAIRVRANDQRTAGANNANIIGLHATGTTSVTTPKIGSCLPCVAGVVGTASQEGASSQNAGGAIYAGVVGSTLGSSGNSNGTGVALYAKAPPVRFASSNIGLYIESGFTNASDLAIRSDATSPSRFRGDIVNVSLSPFANGIVLNGTASILGGLSTSQFSTPAFSSSIAIVGTGGSTTWVYKLVAKDAAGGVVASSTQVSTAVGIASMTAGTNFNRITIQATSFCSVGAKTIDIYRTTAGTSPNTTGKIGTFTIADCTTLFTTQTFDDNALAGDGTSVPSGNTTGGAAIAGDVTFSTGKGQHFNAQAANNDFAGTCTLAAGTCTVTFTRAYANAPVCVVSPSTTGTFTTGAALKGASSTTTLVITSTTGTDTVVADYICAGNPN